MAGTHRPYVSSVAQGNGRYLHTFQCACGARGGNYDSAAGAEAAALRHEANPNRTGKRGTQ